MNSGGLDSYKNYGGSAPKYDIIVYSRSRDSDIMGESNFDSIIKHLDDKKIDYNVERFNHWACGWIEAIFVDVKDTKALKEAYAIREVLNEYPIFNDDDYYSRESESRQQFAQEYSESCAKEFIGYFGLDEELTEDEGFLGFIEAYILECCAYCGEEYYYTDFESRPSSIESCIASIYRPECKFTEFFKAVIGD